MIHQNLDANFIGRDEYIRVLLLGLLTGQNVLVLGPPGTAKTAVISDFFARIKAVSTVTHGGRDWSSTHLQELIDFRTDVYALLDAVNEAPALPLPIDVKAMILDYARFANGLNLTGEASPSPKVVQTQSREVYCSNVITNRGIVAFSGTLRVIAFLHGRGSTPCALDVFPLTYMSWHTAAQRKVVAARMLDKLHDALPALIENNGADWGYDAIRTHLFIPDAIKAMLYSQILADMVQFGLADAVVDLLRIPDVDPSHNSGLLLQAAMDGQHHSLLSMLRLDSRIDTTALDQHEEEEARQLAVRDEETQDEGKSGCESEVEAREIAFPTGDDVDKAVGGDSFRTIAASEEGAQQVMAKVEEQKQVLPVVVGEFETRGEKRVEKQEQDAAEERALELAEKMLDGTRPPDLPALQRLSTLASERDDLITLSAAKSLARKTNSGGSPARSASTTWESRTICVDDIQLPSTDDQHVQWRVPVEPVQIGSALGFNKLSLGLMKMPNVYHFDDLYLNTVKVYRVESVAPIGGSSSSSALDFPPVLSKLSNIAASASLSNAPVVIAPALITGAQSHFVDPIHPDDRTIRDPRWDDLAATAGPNRSPVDAGPTRTWRPSPGSHIVMDDVGRAHQQVDVRALANVGRILQGSANEHGVDFPPPPPYEPRDSLQGEAAQSPGLGVADSDMDEGENVPDLEAAMPGLE
ncbi:hypothetical protein GGF31_001772 [Allomyces arbusculus]|nr:hypothetical protein GGF31_001772 [Allomyces arbusculus]